MKSMKHFLAALLVITMTLSVQAEIEGPEQGPEIMDMLMIADGNSEAMISLEDTGEEASVGMNSWMIDGSNVLYQQWFWFRVAGDDFEQSIDNLMLMDASTIDTNGLVTGDMRDDKALIAYMDPQERFAIQVEFELTGGSMGSGTASIIELISIINLQEQATLEMSFFQYSDFDMGDDEFDETLMINNGNTATQTDSSNGQVSETVVTPQPTAFQGSEYSAILDMLQDEDVDNLDNTVATTNDATWAFQWDMVLNPAGTQGSDLLISKVKHVTSSVIPEPASFALLGLGALCFTRRRKQA